jgi:hypothetical protein
MAQIVHGQAYALFAFDVGYEIALDRLAELLPSAPVQPISRKKQTPTYLQYTNPPHVITIGTAELLDGMEGYVLATIFDFGAVSISYRWQIGGRRIDLEELPALSRELAGRAMEDDARRCMEDLLRRIEPAISRPRLSTLVEDYYIFIVEELGVSMRADELLERYRPAMAHALRFEQGGLSAAQQEESVCQNISYYDHDLTVIDWNAAIIFDHDYEDTAGVLELLNVDLLEARFIDAQLDRKIEEYARLVREKVEWPVPLRNPYSRAIQDLAELRIESSVLNERVDNALKLVGDPYLARIHRSAAQRFSLQEWDRLVSRKLELIDSFHQLLTDRVRAAQSQALELAVIALILLEILLVIFS